MSLGPEDLQGLQSIIAQPPSQPGGQGFIPQPPEQGRFGLQNQPFSIEQLFGGNVLGPPQSAAGLNRFGMQGGPRGGFQGGLLDVNPGSLPGGGGGLRRLR